MAIRPRHHRLAVTAFVILVGSAAGLCAQSPVAVLQFNATISPISSVRVSSDVLTLEPRETGLDGATFAQSIEFRAASRTSQSGEVVLTMEPLFPLDRLNGGGAADGVTSISFEATGEGAQAGMLRDHEPQTVGRWVGSGVRTGRITFAVRGPIDPRGVTVPLRFVLTSP